jgi:hypothetical protein
MALHSISNQLLLSPSILPHQCSTEVAYASTHKLMELSQLGFLRSILVDYPAVFTCAVGGFSVGCKPESAINTHGGGSG